MVLDIVNDIKIDIKNLIAIKERSETVKQKIIIRRLDDMEKVR